MPTFMSIVTYKSSNGDNVRIEHKGFGSVKDATSWMLEKVGYIVLHWGEIDENGLEINAEVCDEGGFDSFDFPFFSDCYNIRCGM